MIHKLPLNEEWIDTQALKIVKKLQSHNHTTYLVGGCVRDLLIGLPPKDFDISTSATPEEVNKIIRPSHIIGRRFQLVLVKRYGEQYEISTFRSQGKQEEDDESGSLIVDDNTFGSPEEDAKRRDFTINSFFYDPVTQELFDYCDGLKDIESRVVRMIGDPSVRIQEDPLRMLRAIRFAHKSHFRIEESLREAIFELAPQLEHTVLPRKREELLKFLRLKTASNLIWELHDLNLLKQLSPNLDFTLTDYDGDLFDNYLKRGLEYVSDSSDPLQLFSVLAFSMLSARNPNFCDSLSLNRSQEEKVSLVFKDEWGMYRNEQDHFFQILKFIRSLKGIDKLSKIRDRYKVHLLKSQAMPYALRLSAAYHLLPASHIHYWSNQYWNRQKPAKS